MAKINLTPQQQAAVNHRGGALLVSAAAGSGKTKVLVSRLLDQVCDPETPRNIDDFLMITYTKKAASELRTKIVEEIGLRLAQEPHNRHLQAQRNRVYLAKISTVHAFCADMLRAYAHLLALPPDFRVGEETECRKLSALAMQQTLDEAYAHILEWDDVRAFIDTLAAGRDDRDVPRLLEQIDTAMQCQLDPEGWAEAAVCAPEAPLEQTPAGIFLLLRFRRQLDEVAAMVQRAKELITADRQLTEKDGPLVQEDLDLVTGLAECTGWDEISQLSAVEFRGLPAIRKPKDPALYAQFRFLRDSYKERVKKLCEPFHESASELLEDWQSTVPAVRGMIRLTKLYQGYYRKERRRRKLLNFSDLEHEMLRLVRNPRTGAPTEAGREISGRFCEIMVDEYQDSNAIQDAIFSAVSRDGRNLFFVGDVKQSIYRFRQADPTIFLEKYQAFQDEPEAGEGRRIRLTANFRSQPAVLDACNAVFETVMSETVGDLSYTEQECLNPGRSDYIPLPQPLVELHVLETGGQWQDEESPAKFELEAAFVAERIARMLRDKTPVSGPDGPRPVEPQDIAILLRAMQNKAPVVLSALRSRGIPAACGLEDDILATTEVAAVLSFLRIIDNPDQDIPLLAALCSPLGGFSADEAAAIRAAHREGTLYDALLAAQDEKSRAFVERISAYRFALDQSRVEDLLETVLADTRAELVFGAMEDGARRLEHLQTLRDFVAAQGGVGCGGLMELLSRIDSLREAGRQIPSSHASRTSGCVTIMSIHTSKGLEFPVVVLMDLSKSFNSDDLRARILTDESLGVGTDIYQEELRVRYPSILKKAIRTKKQEQARSEELRVLYVAMTRAVDRLIMTYAAKNVEKKLREYALFAAKPMPQFCTTQARCPGDWVLMTAIQRTEAGELFAHAMPCDAARVSAYPWEIRLHTQVARTMADVAETAKEAAPETALPDRAELERRLAFSYAHTAATRFPAKLTATQMKGRNLDEEAETGTRRAQRRLHFRTPQFETRTLTPTERGNAAHLFMQFADYAACTTLDGIRAEIARLEREEFLTPQQAQAVEPEQILVLFSSPLGRGMLHSPELLREFKFSLYLDGRKQDASLAGEKIFLQGVVDCCLNEPDGLTIIDFKTDHVTPQTIDARAATYATQVQTYAAAMARIFQKPVKRTLLYFFAAGQAVEIKPE